MLTDHLQNDPSHNAICASLKTRVPKLLKLGTPGAPRAIVIVTAHWSEHVPTISAADKHDLYYDYYGFPPETVSEFWQVELDLDDSADLCVAVQVQIQC